MTEERKKPNFRSTERAVVKEKDGVKEVCAVVVIGSDANKVDDLAKALKAGSKVHSHFVQNAGIMHLSEASCRERMSHLDFTKPDELASIQALTKAIDSIHAEQKKMAAKDTPVFKLETKAAKLSTLANAS